MAQASALKLALEIYHMPSRVRSARSEPLHDGVLQVLRIAAGDDEALSEAATQLERPADLLKEASSFYIEQILLGPGTDSYRVLGADRDAPVGELRRNMALLLRFLHPDLDSSGKRSMFAGRVISAWDDLKSVERRAAYDETLAKQAMPEAMAQRARRKPAGRSERNESPYVSGRSSKGYALSVLPPEPEGFLARALRFLLGPRP